MARVIEIVNDAEKTVIHNACGAKIGYYPKEIREYIHYDYGGGSDMVYYIICPNCGDKITLIGKY